MRKAVPYLISLFTAGMLIAGGWLFVSWTRLGLQKRFEMVRAGLQAMKKTGTLPPELQGKDIEQLDPSQLAMWLPPDAHAFADAADFLAGHSTVLIVVTIVVGFACAFTFNCLRRNRIPNQDVMPGSAGTSE